MNKIKELEAYIEHLQKKNIELLTKNRLLIEENEKLRSEIQHNRELTEWYRSLK